ncbi:hypothetical protein NPJ88_016265 [Halomonas elongata]|nr:hypothetical protein [Halomonas elongata]MDL4863888.1 hypothetical protein [Halomonas elongata]
MIIGRALDREALQAALAGAETATPA